MRRLCTAIVLAALFTFNVNLICSALCNSATAHSGYKGFCHSSEQCKTGSHHDSAKAHSPASGEGCQLRCNCADHNGDGLFATKPFTPCSGLYLSLPTHGFKLTDYTYTPYSHRAIPPHGPPRL